MVSLLHSANHTLSIIKKSFLLVLTYLAGTCQIPLIWKGSVSQWYTLTLPQSLPSTFLEYWAFLTQDRLPTQVLIYSLCCRIIYAHQIVCMYWLNQALHCLQPFHTLQVDQVISLLFQGQPWNVPALSKFDSHSFKYLISAS